MLLLEIDPGPSLEITGSFVTVAPGLLLVLVLPPGLFEVLLPELFVPEPPGPSVCAAVVVSLVLCPGPDVSLPDALVVWLWLDVLPVLPEAVVEEIGPSIGSSDSSKSPGSISSVESSVGLATEDSLITFPASSVG